MGAMTTKVNNMQRDLIGYADNPPHACWPNNAKIAVQFVLNIEEGAENSVIYGDKKSERFLSDILGVDEFSNRHLSIESAFEYGSRVGVWRVLEVFKKYNLPITTFCCAAAVAQNPYILERVLEDGHEVASHGLRWINYQTIPEALEREHIEQATDIFCRLMGVQPLGWYTGRDSPQTRRLVVNQGNYIYDSDSYADELPYWLKVAGKPHLVIPYSLETNDMRFCSSPGYTNAEPFFHYLKDSFDTLYEEGSTLPKMLSVGLHSRVIGRAGRIGALKRFIEYILEHEDVWVCRRSDIAKHWYKKHPPTEDNLFEWVL